MEDADRKTGNVIDRISLVGLKKRYGLARALSGVDLEFRASSICALLGPNGAGKSTLLGIVSTLIRQSEGEVHYYCGRESLEPGRELRRCLGVLSHDSLLYEGLDAVENLQFWSRVYSLGLSEESIRAALIGVNLDPLAWERPVGTYSRGMTQRLALARAMLHKPSVLLLDEPFTGLDRVGAAALTESLRGQKKAGTMLVVVTHDLESIATVADHVVILNRGRVVFNQSRTHLDYAEMSELYRQRLTSAR